MRVLVRAPLSPFIGYGNDGIGIVRALLRWGADVRLQPTHVDAPLPEAVARVLTRTLEPPFDLILNHVDPMNLGVPREARAVADFVLGWTMWEWTNFTGLEDVPGLDTWDERYSSLDLVAAYDQNTADALQTVVPGMPTVVQQGGYEADEWRPIERDWDGHRFGFFMIGHLHSRKNPFAAIEAFRQLKEEHPEEFEPAELHLKTSIPGLHSKLEETCPKLRVHYAIWPTETVRDFYAKQHCLLAPSRGEGKNMPALEFMSTGGVVIATRWGGHLQWLSEEFAYGIDSVLTPEPGAPERLAAEVDVSHLKSLMWHVFTHRAEARRKGQLASELIPQMCSWDAVVERLFLKAKTAVPGKGGRLYGLAQLCRGPSEVLAEKVRRGEATWDGEREFAR